MSQTTAAYLYRWIYLLMVPMNFRDVKCPNEAFHANYHISFTNTKYVWRTHTFSHNNANYMYMVLNTLYINKLEFSKWFRICSVTIHLYILVNMDYWNTSPKSSLPTRRRGTQFIMSFFIKLNEIFHKCIKYTKLNFSKAHLFTV